MKQIGLPGKHLSNGPIAFVGIIHSYNFTLE